MKKYDLIVQLQGSKNQFERFLKDFEARQNFTLKDYPPEMRPAIRQEKCEEIQEVRIFRIGTNDKESTLQYLADTTWWNNNINFDKVIHFLLDIFSGYNKEKPLSSRVNLPSKLLSYFIASRENKITK